jgi:hypothetical protein
MRKIHPALSSTAAARLAFPKAGIEAHQRPGDHPPADRRADHGEAMCKNAAACILRSAEEETRMAWEAIEAPGGKGGIGADPAARRPTAARLRAVVRGAQRIRRGASREAV